MTKLGKEDLGLRKVKGQHGEREDEMVSTTSRSVPGRWQVNGSLKGGLHLALWKSEVGLAQPQSMAKQWGAVVISHE